MDHDGEFICCRCDERLVLMKVDFVYLGRDFSNEMLRCPKCGQVYIPENIVNDKIVGVEQALEGK